MIYAIGIRSQVDQWRKAAGHKRAEVTPLSSADSPRGHRFENGDEVWLIGEWWRVGRFHDLMLAIEPCFPDDDGEALRELREKGYVALGWTTERA